MIYLNKIIKVLNKIVDDTLKSPNGKWSRKSLTMFTSFVFALMFGTYIVMCNLITTNPLSHDAITVFWGLISLSGGTSFLTVYQKLQGKIPKIEKEHLSE